MPRNNREIIVRDRHPDIRVHRDKLITDLYTIHKYTLAEIGTVFYLSPQGVYKIIKANGQ